MWPLVISHMKAVLHLVHTNLPLAPFILRTETEQGFRGPRRRYSHKVEVPEVLSSFTKVLDEFRRSMCCNGVNPALQN